MLLDYGLHAHTHTWHLQNNIIHDNRKCDRQFGLGQQYLLRFKMYILFLEFSLLGIYPRETPAYVYKDVQSSIVCSGHRLLII